QQGGYQTPPQTAAYSPQQGAATPPPYNLTPQQSSLSAGRSGGGKNNKGVIMGAIAVSVLAVGGLIVALSLNLGSEAEGGDDGAGASPSPTVVEGHKGPDTSKVIDSTECTEPTESYNDPDKIELPDFTFKNIDSVKKCFQAAGWQYDVQKVDENTYGEGTVMEQYPAASEDVDPKDMPSIILKVSTGNPA
ncbi:Stk1 family PASTA domain-containing Ser/Thr kinase, partial [Streptomyces sp. AC495_CC817]|uniref:Stk1 family PASTA domain-containing Ser/Thr kinase n=1 Tax=Streptomyces sp. AC495_CC817 TaxID=2823900 RepID=UPI001C267D4E